MLRIPRAESHTWDLDELGNAHQWLRWAAPNLPLAIPEPVAICEASDLYPWPWPVHRWLEGASLDSVDFSSSADTAERLAEFVVALHRLPAHDGPRSYEAVSRSTWEPQFRKLLPDLEGVIDTRRAVAAWELTMEADSWRGPFPWTHADLLPGNLIAGHDRLRAVLDFECLGTGDPALDMSCAWWLFDRPTRDLYRHAVGADDATWLRAANFALRAVMGIRYYETTNPRFSAMALRAITEAIDDLVPAV